MQEGGGRAVGSFGAVQKGLELVEEVVDLTGVGVGLVVAEDIMYGGQGPGGCHELDVVGVGSVGSVGAVQGETGRVLQGAKRVGAG